MNFLSIREGKVMKKWRIPPMGKPTKLFLRIAMPAVLFYSVAILISYLDARTHHPLLANLLYAPFLEYIVACLEILVCGSLIIEVAQRDTR